MPASVCLRRAYGRAGVAGYSYKYIHICVCVECGCLITSCAGVVVYIGHGQGYLGRRGLLLVGS